MCAKLLAEALGAHRAYDLGVHAAIDAARIGAITIECADDAGSFRKRIRAEALVAFAEAAEGLKLAQVEHPVHIIMREISADPAPSGEAECPFCASCLKWVQDSSNGHVHAQCVTSGCLCIMP
ncbi:hypothetical protein [Methylobacterium flocculans]|uniref:hypothetical protein n=1 Tax=Methylobacterium flocculans TaxID=2984843 RepID=UPI0021F274C8|nr:hypothetical protein [Methylobacterium sp. FF17]